LKERLEDEEGNVPKERLDTRKNTYPRRKTIILSGEAFRKKEKEDRDDSIPVESQEQSYVEFSRGRKARAMTFQTFLTERLKNSR